MFFAISWNEFIKKNCIELSTATNASKALLLVQSSATEKVFFCRNSKINGTGERSKIR